VKPVTLPPFFWPLLVLVLTAVALTGCSKPARIDASDDAALEASLERITAGMSNDEKRKFLESCGKFIAPLEPADTPVLKQVPGSQAARYRALDGLTAAEVLAKAAAAGSEPAPANSR
jgi:hypothetical protein